MIERSSPALHFAAGLCALLLGGCTPATTDGGSPAQAIAPRCTILCLTVSDKTFPGANAPLFDGIVLVSERTDPTIHGGFTAFRGMSGSRGNSAVGFTSDVYGISEAWLRNPFAAEVFRAQAHPARRGASGDFRGAAWSIQAQDAAGAWSPIFVTASAFTTNDAATPAAAGLAAPQLMPVGRANLQMFACAGERAEDGRVQTIWLLEAISPNAASGRQGSVDFIQDLLNGDDRFVPNAPGTLRGPPTPPTPTIRGPGYPNNDVSVQCAITQFEDDVATRELHMLALNGGKLFHSMASNFGPATTGGGSTINRFNAISPWGDVSQALGVNFGPIVSATLVARPADISVFFVAASGGRYRLWHTVRHASGAWRPADDVLALSGDAPNGTVDSWQVAAGLCPSLGAADWTAQNTEIIVALWGGPNADEVVTIEVVQTPREWRPGVTGIYSPLRHVDNAVRGTDPSRNPHVQNVVVTARPFSDAPP